MVVYPLCGIAFYTKKYLFYNNFFIYILLNFFIIYGTIIFV